MLALVLAMVGSYIHILKVTQDCSLLHQEGPTPGERFILLAGLRRYGIKRILVDYQLERARVRSRKQWYWRILLAGVNIHLDAWLDYRRLNIVGHLSSWAEEAA